MKNKIKDFKTKVDSLVLEQKKRMNTSKKDAFIKIGYLKLNVFNNLNPYSGEFDNVIFFTYNDHYAGNSSTAMTINALGHPHTNMDDRGYIKGVATDLKGYMTLRGLKTVHNFECVYPIYYPKFIKSKHQEAYYSECTAIVDNAMRYLNEYRDLIDEEINARLKELTGCNLMHYIRPI